MSKRKNLNEGSDSHGHLVQLYQADEPALAANVGQYLWEGYNRGAGLLVVANPRNTESFRAELEKRGADLNRMVRQRHLVFWDAEETLARIMVGYRPEWPSFERGHRRRHASGEAPG